MKVSDVMTKRVVYCLKGDTAQAAAELMKTCDIGAVPVVADWQSKRLEGIVTDRDLCVRLVFECKDPLTTRVSELMTWNVASCSPDDPLDRCEERMRLLQIRRLPVVDETGCCIGMLSQADIALNDTADNVRRMVEGISTPRLREPFERHAA
jgi:CBS domain-containing protein